MGMEITEQETNNLYKFIYMLGEYVVFSKDEKSNNIIYGTTENAIVHKEALFLKTNELFDLIISKGGRVPAPNTLNGLEVCCFFFGSG